MRFVYVFSLMFPAIFGLAALMYFAARAIYYHRVCRHDIYVKSGEDISALAECLHSLPCVERIVIVSSGDEWDSEAARISKIYGNVIFTDKENVQNGRLFGK